MPRSRPSEARPPAETSAGSAPLAHTAAPAQSAVHDVISFGTGPRRRPRAGRPALRRLRRRAAPAPPRVAAAGGHVPGHGTSEGPGDRTSGRIDRRAFVASTLPARIEDTGGAPAEGHRDSRPGAADPCARGPARPGSGSSPAMSEPRACAWSADRLDRSTPDSGLPRRACDVNSRTRLEHTMPEDREGREGREGIDGIDGIDGGGSRRRSQRAATTSTDAAPLTIAETETAARRPWR